MTSTAIQNGQNVSRELNTFNDIPLNSQNGTKELDLKIYLGVYAGNSRRRVL